MKMNTPGTIAYEIWQFSVFEGRRPIKCKYCRRSYKYIRSFNLHMKEKHINNKRLMLPNKQTIMSVPKRVKNPTGTIQRHPAGIYSPSSKILRRNQGCGTQKGTWMNLVQSEDVNQFYVTKSTTSKPTRRFSVIIPNPNC